MKFAILLLSAMSAASISFAQPQRGQPNQPSRPSQPSQPSQPTRPPEPQQQRVDLVTVYRSSNPTTADHFYSIDPREGPAAGLTSEPNGDFQIAYRPGAGFDKALYRCRLTDGSGNHFLSNDPNCEGQSSEGRLSLLGYAASSSSSTDYNVEPIRRYSSGQDHVVCLPNERPSGYQAEGVLGYVIPLY